MADNLQMFKNTVRSLLTDKGFELRTDKAQKSHLITARLLKWTETNEKAAADFSWISGTRKER